ncbi:hypothetical protein NEPAR04_0139 [Nematocida parisii]|nr:hypothetical protein NEPAR03_0133 [Nematocida parisii]KAI5125773.1 hypothetical protein NEPAR08_0211 [Nematocida parisii]KAI5140194.1 hypothetical protein NEPAR04_0139 [Nematocida parisii]
MVEVLNQEKESVYRQFIAKVRQAGFVRLVCISREIDHFAALFSLIVVLEREIIKHEVIWEDARSGKQAVFEIGIGQGCKVENGAVISTQKEKHTKNIMFLLGETLEEVIFNLCKSIGHMTPECLWSICVSMYGSLDKAEQMQWRHPIKNVLGDRKAKEEDLEETEDEDFEQKENIYVEDGDFCGIKKEIAAEVSRLERDDDDEKKSIQQVKGIYFSFSQWCTLYEALLQDFGVIEELGLFFQRKNTKHCLLENPEYLLNQFLARLGVSVAAAQETSLNNLVGPVQEVIRRSFNKRQTYFKHYQYNLGFSHVEVFYSICHLIKNGAFTEAVFSFRNIKFIDVHKGLAEYNKVVHSVKKGIEKRRVLKVCGMSMVLIPKGAVVFMSKNEITLMKKVFGTIYYMCKEKNPHKEIIMAAYIENSRIFRVFFKEEDHIRWEDTEEKNLNNSIVGILTRLEEE